jgi:integrase
MSTSDRSGPSRRVSAGKRYPGIYFRHDARGRKVYEHDYYDETGKRRWLVLPAGATLKAAQASREEHRAKRRRGETFAPAKVPTVNEYGPTWLDSQVALRPRTREAYTWGLAHAYRHLGRLRVNEVRADDIAELIGKLRREGLAARSVTGVLGPLSGMFNAAVRKGLRAGNPVAELRPTERPRSARRAHRVLSADELRRLLAAAEEPWRLPLTVLALSGLRVSELLGLVWSDIDLDAGVLHVRAQLQRNTSERVEPKTPEAVREIDVLPELVAALRRHKLASPASGAEQFVFCNPAGHPLDHRALTRRGLDRAVKRAGLDEPGKPKITPHGLRKNYGSSLIAAGEDIAAVSAALGHADVAITLRVYTRAVDRAARAERTRARLAGAFGTVLERSRDEQRQTAANVGEGETAQLRKIG